MRRLIAWFAANGVAPNLLMASILVGGLLMAGSVTMEVFPELASDIVTVSLPYPGAAPEEVEEGVVIRVEEEVQDLEGIKEIRSTAAENAGTVMIEAEPGADLQKLLGDVKNRVDSIDTFPEEAEVPVISELVVRRQVISVAIAGRAGDRTLKRIGEQVRDDLVALPGITQVELAIARPYEISIEVSEEALRRWGLSFDRVASAIRRASLDLPGGSLETEGGEILLRTKGQVYTGREFAALPLLTLADGSRLKVGDVAEVVDGFADTDQSARFDGLPAVMVQVFRVGDQSALGIAGAVKAYVEETRASMPEGIRLTTWQDDSRILEDRLSLMIRNGRTGFVLVFLVLALFLRLKLAGWVALGIPISFLGAVLLMPWLDVTINLMSLFAFIVVLGIVVDDAIVVGENIYTHFESGKERLRAAVDGANEVAVPVVFAILTTIAAFSPLLAVEGNIGKIMRVIPLIVISVLAFSLIESLLILPNHLSHLTRAEAERERGPVRRTWQGFRGAFAKGLARFVETGYRPFLDLCLRWRYVTLAAGFGALILIGGLVGGGWIQFVFLPSVEADNVVAILEMPQGTTAAGTERALARVEAAALELEAELEEETGAPVFRHVLTTIGAQPFRTEQARGPVGTGPDFRASHLGEINIELVPAEERDVSSSAIGARWREKSGAIPGTSELTFTSSLFGVGSPIDIELTGPDMAELREVAARAKEAIARYPGTEEIADSFREGKEEVELEITAEGQAAGLTLADLARQVRQAFYGEEAQRIQRGRDDVKVMIRYPEAERVSLADLERMRFRLPDGTEIPFSTAARARLSRGPSAIERIDRRRVIHVTADVDEEAGNANEILADLTASALPEILADYPRVRYALGGEQQEQRETLEGLKRGFLFALLAIYVLLAIPFRSYFQPVIVMSAIPFGLIGAVLGHLILGMDLTILSMFGIVALTGVVVNDSLVMVDFINRDFRAGTPLLNAIRESGAARFRPILLTSLTTFAGLAPLLFERSLQAKFLIPMAVSLAFGILFATVIILILVPTLYFVLEDWRAWMGMRSRRGETERREEWEDVA